MNTETAGMCIRLMQDKHKSKFPVKDLETIKSDLLQCDDKAMENVADKICTDHLVLPDARKLLNMVQTETKRLRQVAAQKREDDWKQEKGENSRGRVEGSTFLNKQQRTEYDRRSLMLLRGMINEGPSETIAEGCLVMANAYPHVADEWRDLRQNIIAMLNISTTVGETKCETV